MKRISTLLADQTMQFRAAGLSQLCVNMTDDKQPDQHTGCECDRGGRGVPANLCYSLAHKVLLLAKVLPGDIWFSRSSLALHEQLLTAQRFMCTLSPILCQVLRNEPRNRVWAPSRTSSSRVDAVVLMLMKPGAWRQRSSCDLLALSLDTSHQLVSRKKRMFWCQCKISGCSV